MKVDPYELWAITGRSEKLLGTYNSLAKLQRAWRKHVLQHSLNAIQIVGDTSHNINNQMPISELNEYRTAEERDAKVINDASYFTVVRFMGVGQYERFEVQRKGDAFLLAEFLSRRNKANYMVYAVNRLGLSAFIKNVIYTR